MLKVDGDIEISAKLFHKDDSNTFLHFVGADDFRVVAGGKEYLSVTHGDTEVCLNEGGEAHDFRVEGDTNQNLFFVDGSTDRVGINTNAPTQLFDISNVLTFDGSDLKVLEAVNDGNPSLSIGGADAEKLLIQPVFDSGAQTLDYVKFSTAVASATANKGKYIFDVDGTDIVTIDDGGIDVASGKTFAINGTDVVVTDTTYSAGDGLTLSSTTFSNDVIGKQSIWIPAAAMYPTATAGCAAIASLDSGGNTGPDLYTLDFDGSSEEHAQFSIAMPSYWNESTVTFQVYWTSETTDTDGVVWGLAGVALANDNSLNTAFGTEVVVADANIGTAKDLHVTSVSSAVTIAGSPAAGEICYFNIARVVGNGSDTAAEDAKLIGVKLFYTVDDVHEA
jgi:hypothetical protein